ncbi:MAG: phospho-sugar mutase [Actinomycetota bacterium]
MISNQELLERAKAWTIQDPDPETVAELEKLIRESDFESLRDRFDTRLGFGTAGLRGALGAGPNRMNRVLVSQAAIGLGNYLKGLSSDASVVIGFDGRKNSKIFAQDSAELMAGMGIKVFLFDDLVATPMIAYAVKKLSTSAGVMVTASHNPPGDNGYKVYDESGSQIISPVDAQIAAEIDSASKKDIREFSRSDNFQNVPKDLLKEYLQQAAQLASRNAETSKLKIVYSAMHGVGAKFVEEAFEMASLPKPIQVEQQKLPDPKFPTVSFPNPEEPGAMDLALEKANLEQADLILVNDPDADRLAVAVRTKFGEMRQLTGDQVGLILGDEMAQRAQKLGISGNLAASIVSSSALEKVAQHYGMGFMQTLTGFKWISRVPNLIFGYEEALGYCVDWQRVRDKDGISAAVVVADLAMKLWASGQNLLDQLEKLAERYGYFATSQISIRVTDLGIIKSTMENLRANPPADIAGSKTKFTDLLLGSETLGPTDGLRFDLEDGRRVIVRPSGTEPKLKCYLQAVASTDSEAGTNLGELEKAMRKILA